MVFVRIDGGSVDGGAEGDSESPSSAGAQVIAPFCLAAFETTQGQLEAVLGEEADHSRFRGVDLPAERVTWDEPREFVRRLNERAGAEVFRLPTSAEWEHAARAGTTTAYSFGDDPAELHRYGNCLSGEGPDDGFDNRTAPVGSFEPNPWGLYDMHGNVWEWVTDPAEPVPERNGDPPSPGKSAPWRLRRGGAFTSHHDNCRSDASDPANPERRESDGGFRVVREVVSPTLP
jgi:formylglycine-generating enzyme required for sulfatase activity